MIKLIPKDIDIAVPKIVTLSFLNDSHTIIDNPGIKADRSDRFLRIQVNGGEVAFSLAGADYDAFYARFGGGYTDENVNTIVMERLGLTAAPEQ